MKSADLLNAMGTCSGPPERKEDLDWSSGTPLLFAFYTMSTIGYGDINVITVSGRKFAIGYSLVGMWVFGWFSDAIANVLEQLCRTAIDCVLGDAPASAGASASASAASQQPYWRRWKRRRYGRFGSVVWQRYLHRLSHFDMSVRLVRMFVACTSFCLLFSAVVWAIEREDDGQQWTFFDSFWFVFVTCTTIGFGDMSPSRALRRWYASAIEIACTMIGLVVVAMGTGLLVDLFVLEVDELESGLEHMADHAEHAAAARIQAIYSHRGKQALRADGDPPGNGDGDGKACVGEQIPQDEERGGATAAAAAAAAAAVKAEDEEVDQSVGLLVMTTGDV